MTQRRPNRALRIQPGAGEWEMLRSRARDEAQRERSEASMRISEPARQQARGRAAAWQRSFKTRTSVMPAGEKEGRAEA